MVVALISPNLASAEVWRATETWNEEWENRYSEWIEHSFHERFFLENEWAGIETDCADAVYASRIIFSFQNSLPFALSGTRERQAQFTNSTKDFDSISDPIQRVKAFLDRVNGRTWTGSLAKHTYPIEISKATVVPGAIWLKPGHVEIVKSVRPSGIVELQGSWLPASIRQMITITTLGAVPKDETTGFRRWIWPQNMSKSLAEQPKFAKPEVFPALQENLGTAPRALEVNQWLSAYEESVRAKLASNSMKESKARRVQRLAHDFCKMAHARQEVVQLGADYLSRRTKGTGDTASCLVPKEYHLFSTPSRDSNLRRVVIALSLELKNQLDIVRKTLTTCPPIEGDGYSISAEEFLVKLIRLDFSSNPHESMSARFGLEPARGLCELAY